MGSFLFFSGAGIMLFAIVVSVILLSRITFYGAVSSIRSKPKEASATILNKRKQDMMRSSGVYTNYFMLFDLGGGDKLELPINKKLFKADNIGKSGTLIYKGGIFISFTEAAPPKPKKETYVLNGEVVEK